MRRMNAVAFLSTVALAFAAFAAPANAQVTAYEGARIIAGDGRAPIENGTVVVDGAKITQVGPPPACRCRPARRASILAARPLCRT